MALKLAIWDMDGTLLDSRQAITRIMASAFEARDLPPPGYDQIRRVVGLSLDQACRILAPQVTDDAAIDQLVAAYRRASSEQRLASDSHEPLYDGALEALQSLADGGWLIALATGKSRHRIAEVFERHGLDAIFDSIHSPDDGPGKPNPAMVISALDKFGVETSDAVMIGDAVFDMQMARAAGVTAHGVSWGFGATHELIEAGAHAVHDDFTSLNAALDDFDDRARLDRLRP